jgi:hypothetical protein
VAICVSIYWTTLFQNQYLALGSSVNQVTGLAAIAIYGLKM